MYLYEFGETSAPVRCPRRVLPYALITLERKPCVTLDTPFLAVDSGSSELRWEVKGETRRGFRWTITKNPASRQSLKQKVDQVRRRRSQSKEENQKQLHDTGDCPPILNRYDNELSSKQKNSGDEPPILDKHTKLDSIVREIGTKKERIQQIQEQRNTRERSSSPFRDIVTKSNSGEEVANISITSNNSQSPMSHGNVTTVQIASTDSNKCVNSDTCISVCSEIDISATTTDDSLQSEFWRNGEIDLLKTHSENSYTRTQKHKKTHSCHSVPRNLPSSLKPFINLTRIDSNGNYKGNRKPNSLKGRHLHRNIPTIQENQNTSTVAVADKMTQSAVQKISEIQSSLTKNPTNGRIRLKITTNGRKKGMVSSLIDDNGLLVKRIVKNGLSIHSNSSSQLQSSANGEAKDDTTVLQGDVLNLDKSVVSSKNIVSSQYLDRMDTCKTNSYLFSSVDKTEPVKRDKFSNQKTNKSNADLHEGPEYDLGKTKVSNESQNCEAENENLNDLESHGPVKISTVQTCSRKSSKKQSFVSPRQSCNIICVDHERQPKDVQDINSNVINNSSDGSTLGEKYEISSQRTGDTLLHAFTDTIQSKLSLNGIGKNKSSSTGEKPERNNYCKRNKQNSLRGNLFSDNLNEINNEIINKKNVTRNRGKKSKQNKNATALVGYTNDFFAGTENEGLSGGVSKARAHVSKSKSSSLQGCSMQALNDDRKSFDITVMTKRNNLVDSEGISYGDKISAHTCPLFKDEINLYDSSHATAVLQTKLDKCAMSSSTDALDSNCMGQREYMAGLALQRACSSEVIGTLEDGTMSCSKSVEKQDEPDTDISEANICKRGDESINLNQGNQTKTIHEKTLVSSDAGSYNSAKETVLDNFTIKTKKSISGMHELLKNKCGLKYYSGVLNDTSIPASINNSCKNPDLATERKFAVQNTAPHEKTHISSLHPGIRCDISPQVANEAPFLSNCLPNISSACGSDEDNLEEAKNETNSNSLSCSEYALAKPTGVTDSTSSYKQTRSTSPHQITSTKNSSCLLQCHDLNKSDQNQHVMLPSDEDKFPELRNILSSNIGVSIKRTSDTYENTDKGCIDHADNQKKIKGKMLHETEKTNDYKRIPTELEKGSTPVSLQNTLCQLNLQATDSRPNINARKTSAILVNEEVNEDSAINIRDSCNSGTVKTGSTVDSETAKKLQKFLQESIDRAQKQKLISRECQKIRNQRKCPETSKAKSSDCKSLASTNHSYSKPMSAKENILSFNSNSATSADKRRLNTEQKITGENTSYQTCSTEQLPTFASHLPVGHAKPVLHRSDSQETVIGGIPDYYLTPPSFSWPADECRERHAVSLNTQKINDESVVQKNNSLDLLGSKSFAAKTRHSTDSEISFRKDISQMGSSLTRRTDNTADTLDENYVTQIVVSKDNMCPLDLTTKKVKDMDLLSTVSDKSKDPRKGQAENESCATEVTRSDNISSNQTGKIVESNVDTKKEETPSTKETQSEITKTLHQLSQVLQEISKLSESKESKAADHSLHKQSTCKTISLGNENHKYKPVSDCLTQSKLSAGHKKDTGQTVVSATSKRLQISKEKRAHHDGNQPKFVLKQVSRKKTSNDTTNVKVKETNQQSMQQEDISVNCSLTSVLRQEDIRVMQDHYQHKTQTVCISDTSVANKTCSPDTSLNSIKDSDNSKIQHNKHNQKLESIVTGNKIQTEPKNICMQKGGSDDVNKNQNLTVPSNIGIKSTVRSTSELQGNITTLRNIEIKTESGTNASESDKCYVPSSNDKFVNSDKVHFNRNLITIKTEPIDFEFAQNERLSSESTIPAEFSTRKTVSVSGNIKGGAIASSLAEKRRSESRNKNCMEYLRLNSTSHLQQEQSVQQVQMENPGLAVEASATGDKSFNSKSILKSHDDPQSCTHENQKYQNKPLDTLSYSEELCQPNTTRLSQTSSSKDAIEPPNILNLKRNYHHTDGFNTKSTEKEERLNDMQCTDSQKGTVNVSLHDDKTESSPMVSFEYKECLLSHEENDIDSAKIPYVFDGQDEPDITLLERFGNPVVKLLNRQIVAAPIPSNENDEQGLSPVNEASHSEQQIARPISCSEESILLGNEISHIDKMIDVPISLSEDSRKGKQDLPLVKEEGSHIKQETDIVAPSTTSATSDSKPTEMQTRTRPKGVRNRSEKGLLNKGGKFVSGIRKSKNVNETSCCVTKQAPVSLCVPLKPAVQTSGLINEGVICSPADAEAVSLRIDEFLKTERKKSDSQSTDIKDSHTGTSSVSSICSTIQKVHTDETPITTVEHDCNSNRKRSRSTSCLSKERESKRMRNSKEKTGSNEPIENLNSSNETAKRKGFDLIPFSEIVRLKAEGLRLGCNRYGRYVYRSHRTEFNKIHRRKAMLNGSKASIDYKTKRNLNVLGTRRDFKCKKSTQDKGVVDTRHVTSKIQTSDKANNEAREKVFLKENEVLKERVLKLPAATESRDSKRKSSEPDCPLKVSSQDSYNGFDAFKYKTKPEDNTGLSKHKLRNRFNKGGLGYLNWRRRYPGQHKREISSDDRNMLQGNRASFTKRVLTESERVAEREKAKKEIEEAVRHFRRTYEGTWEDFIADGKVASYLDTITDKLEVIQSKRNKINDDTKTDQRQKYTPTSQRNTYGNRLEQKRTNPIKAMYLTDKKGNKSTRSPNFSAPPESLLQEIVKEQFIKKVESVTTQVTKELTERFIEGIGYSADSSDSLLETQRDPTDKNEIDFDLPCQQDGIISMRNDKHFHISKFKEISAVPCNTNRERYNSGLQKFNGNDNFSDLGQHYFLENEDNAQKMLAKNVSDLERRYATNRRFFGGKHNCAVFGSKNKQNKFSINNANRKMWHPKRTQSGEWGLYANNDIVNQRFGNKNARNIGRSNFNKIILYNNEQRSNIRKGSVSSNESDIALDDTYEIHQHGNSKDSSRQSFGESFPRREYSKEHRRSRSRSSSVTKIGVRRSNYGRDEMYNGSSFNDSNKNHRRSGSNLNDRIDRMYDSEYGINDEMDRNSDCYSKNLFFIDHGTNLFENDDASRGYKHGDHSSKDDYHPNKSRRSHSNEKTCNKRRSNSNDGLDYHERSRSTSSQNSNIVYQERSKNDNYKLSAYKHSDNRHRVSFLDRGNQCYDKYSEKGDNKFLKESKSRYDQDDTHSGIQKRCRSDRFKRSHNYNDGEHYRRDRNYSDRGSHGRSDKRKSLSYHQGHFKPKFNENHSKGRNNRRRLNRSSSRNRSFHR